VTSINQSINQDWRLETED